MSDYLIPRGKVTFEEAFPELENVNIKISFLRGGGREEKTEIFTKDNFTGNGVRCSNPDCKNGGLSAITILSLIKKMISEKKVQLEEHKFCNGGLYKGQTRYNDCGWSFNIDISIQLKEDS